MTSISITTSKLCLITPGVCVCVCVCVGGGGGNIFCFEDFSINVTVNTDQNEQMLWLN